MRNIKSRSRLISFNLFLFVIFTVSLSGCTFDRSWIKKQITGEKDVNIQNQTGSSSPVNEQLDGEMINKLFSFDLIRPAFADLGEISQAAVKASIPAVKIKTEEIGNFDSFDKNAGIDFSKEQIKALEDNGFFLANMEKIDEFGPNLDDFVDYYLRFQGNYNPYLREPQNTVFITSDLALHIYHVLIDRSFQKIEEKKFQPQIREMTEVLFRNSVKNYNAAGDVRLKDSYKRLSVFYLVPLVVLDAGQGREDVKLNPDDFKTFAEYEAAVKKQEEVGQQKEFTFSLDKQAYSGVELSDEIFQLARAELKLVSEAKGITSSPLFTSERPEFKNDYSQFKPRSHYTKNDILRSYFIAMMWYGRLGFTLNSTDLTRDAIIITGQVNSLSVKDQKISKIWGDMATAIDFFVGEVDDLTPFEYTKEIIKVFGQNLKSDQISDNIVINNFIDQAVKDLPAPKILSEAIMMNAVDEKTKDELLKATMQFRFFGQRFTPDAYVINRLTQGDEAADPETGQKLPSTPTALMFISLLNSDNKVVKNELDNWINDKARIVKEGRESDKVIAKFYSQLDQEFSTYTEKDWTKNIYWSWLNCFRPLLSAYGEGYPLFMTNENWQKKNLETALGSFTELKHDTLLYAKQSYAELGGGAPDVKMPPIVKGYVEPDLLFWTRLLNLAKTTETGLKSRDILPDEYADRHTKFIGTLTFLKGIVEKELRNQKIGDEDFEKLRTIVESGIKLVIEPLPGEELTLKEKRAGIIADIHTNVLHNEILYEATGQPYTLFVAVKDSNGIRLTRGAVYRHYEFTENIDGRLSDEDWQKRVYEKDESLPSEDRWAKGVIK